MPRISGLGKSASFLHWSWSVDVVAFKDKSDISEDAIGIQMEQSDLTSKCEKPSRIDVGYKRSVTCVSMDQLS